ncbi:MAG: peptidylprolyl isomerase [Steroidobacteraceae bacterium]|jgi:FKBP-type peptidyl-prolyl cis-trans isomerase SlyD|nr:peptidylprolyl isomerase [Steroidobacteraceae bacterium]
MKIAEDKVVSIHYTLKDSAGTVLDASAGSEPLAYLHGAGNIIPGLENALEGKKSGDKLSVTVEPSQGYGERDERLVQAVPRSAFKGIDQLAPGMQFQAQGPQGTRLVVVTHVATDVVTVDANHPLAGQTLHFEVEIAEVRDATSEELEHGHVHGPGGHHHH